MVCLLVVEALEELDEKGHLGPHSVLGLVEDDALWAIDDLSSALDTTGGWKAVHEDGVLLGLGHELGGNLVWLEDSKPLLELALWNVVGKDGVSVDDVGALDGSIDIVGDDDLTTGLLAEFLALVKDLLLDGVLLIGWAAAPALEAEHGANPHEIVGDVVSNIAEVGEDGALEGAPVLNDGLEVSKHLAWVSEVIKSVDDWDLGVLGEFAHVSTLVESGHDNIDHALKNVGGVIDGLLSTKWGVGDGVEDSVATELGHAGFEGNAGTEGWLLEEHEESLLLEDVSVLLWASLDPDSELQGLLELLSSEGGSGKDVAAWNRHVNEVK